MQWYLPAIVGFAEQAGIPYQSLATMAALAWTISQGDDHYHQVDPFGDGAWSDQRGLWGIDLARFPDYQHRDLYDPRQNARIAAVLLVGSPDNHAWFGAPIPDQLLVDVATQIVASGQRADPLRDVIGGAFPRAEAIGLAANLVEHRGAGMSGPIMEG